MFDDKRSGSVPLDIFWRKAARLNLSEGISTLSSDDSWQCVIYLNKLDK
jgi:hypothetical protein